MRKPTANEDNLPQQIKPARQLMKGNEAVVYGALLGGSTHFFGYPITPASEITHTAARYFPLSGRRFLQVESEVSVINMLYGAASAGARAMSASSGPGISLMAEGLSYLAGAELPCVLVDVQRAGPGLGNIWPEQSDYNAVVKGGGHGNYHNIVFAPASVQEMCDFTYRAFELAEQYRMTVFILADAYIGQMMGPVLLPETVRHARRQSWAVYGDKASRHNLITSIYMSPTLLAEHNEKLQLKYQTLANELSEYEEVEIEGADLVFVAFGIMARICYSVVKELRKQGVKAGLFRPKTLFPLPRRRLQALSHSTKQFIVAELNNGMLADDIQLALASGLPVTRYNWMGGIVPSVQEIVRKVLRG
jgi:pyruvate/2-oxoacid:ferredoxin oxidoreductase alpha subunit